MPLRNFKTNTNREHLFWRFFLALTVAGILLLVSTASVKAAWEMYQTFDLAATERAVAEDDLAALQAEYKQMAAVLQGFASDRGVEAAVRERFGVVRPGEGEIRIVRTGSVQLVGEEETTNPFHRLFNALFAW